MSSTSPSTDSNDPDNSSRIYQKIISLKTDGSNLAVWQFNLPRLLRTQDLDAYLEDPEKFDPPDKEIDETPPKSLSVSEDPPDETPKATGAKLPKTAKLPKKIPNPAYTKWRREAQKATDLMVKTLQPEHYPFVTQADNAPRVAYNLIVARYTSDSTYARQQAEHKISMLHYSSTDTTISTHIATFDSYVTDLANVGVFWDEPSKIYRLLLTITDPDWVAWVQAKDVFRKGGLIRSYAEFCNDLQSEALRQTNAKAAIGLQQGAVALAATAAFGSRGGRGGRGGGNGSSRRQCFHCGRTGHVIADCRDKQRGQPQSAAGAAARAAFDGSRSRLPTTPSVSANMTATPTALTAFSASDFTLFQQFLAFKQAQEQHTSALRITVAVAHALNPTSMIIDGGCNNHVFQSRTLFHDYTDLADHIPVYVADDRSHPAIGRGSVSFVAVVGSPPRHQVVTLKNVLYCPGLSGNLISESHLAKTANLEISLKGTVKTVKVPDRVIMEAHETNGLYRIRADLATHVSSVRSNEDFVLA